MTKLLTFSLLAALAIAAPTLAQGLPPGGPGGPGGPGPGGGQQAGSPPETALKDVLGLSDDQITAIKAALDTRKQAADTLMPQLRDAEKALADALKAASPDATQIGTLLLNVQAIRAQLDQANEALKTAVTKLLTQPSSRRSATSSRSRSRCRQFRPCNNWASSLDCSWGFVARTRRWLGWWATIGCGGTGAAFATPHAPRTPELARPSLARSRVWEGVASPAIRRRSPTPSTPARPARSAFAAEPS